ncbi:dihydrolipoyl transacylase [Salpingoeca rosetta]|uniref:Dihydrolipoamide acetyltransferase component of pyruvate dehydrogenase complex n=1 Tax=Salpingoeca rosetta (strain ATCC 50818 / BSB-021) TaxID=946362 RepID=F2UF77_SALR5|nr:dihydrolipoyl transacylase [Salpingoeca rosetta]EGD75277.1 dihydrolipoyl transacylase [Salpingoeca rosetta]|eukprot:XP_004992330.1 dihydrolipoyl transacylase [Salpingoeca rosetta]
MLAGARSVVGRVLPRAVVRAGAGGLQAQQRTLHWTPVACKKVVPFLLADIGEGIAQATLLEWHVSEGDHVNQFDPVCDVASDKANVDISSRYDGKVVKLHYEVGEMAIVGKPLIDIEVEDDDDGETDEGASTESATSEADATAESPAIPEQQGATAGPARTGKVLMTPAVRRIVRENNIPIEQVVGTGKNGRVLKEDVLNYLEHGAQPAQAPATATTVGATASASMGQQQATATTGRGLAEDQTQPISGIQAAMVKSMTAALKVPHFSYAEEIEMDGLMEARQTLRAMAADSLKVSYMPFIIKAASLALEKYPILNSHVNEECTSVTLKAEHNISVAMDTPLGLVVPNIKNVNNKSVFDIARDLNELQELGAKNKLKTEHLTGGTFTLSNIGVLGGTYLGPVIVVPQVAIGAMGRVRKLPRFDDNDNVIARHIMEISFSADHRVIDGVTIAKFSNEMKQFIEHPLRLLAHLK